MGKVQNLTHLERLAILVEEVGEVSKEVHDLHFESEHPKYCKGSNKRLKKELVQVAAVVQRWIKSIS